MRHRYHTIVYGIGSLLIATFIISCEVIDSSSDDSQKGPIERKELSRELTEAESIIASRSSEFGFDLLRNLYELEGDQNLLISPFSITMTYSMLMNGANDETLKEIQDALDFEEMNQEVVNKSLLELRNLLLEADDQIELNIANAIWHRDSLAVDSVFIDESQHYYNAIVKGADFDEAESIEEINEWVSEQTDGDIPEILKGFSPYSVLFLVNAVSFDGEWTYEFDSGSTSSEPFHKSDNETIEVPRMKFKETTELEYARTDLAQVANLYYGDAGYAMTVVLPNKDVELSDVIDELDVDLWSDWNDQIMVNNIQFEIPKFQVDYEVNSFNSLMQSVGIEKAFVPAADFNKLSPYFYLSNGRHRTVLEVDESGTRSAAATSAHVIQYISVSPTNTMIVNRPFLYVIREVESDTILFLGIMNDPSI